MFVFNLFFFKADSSFLKLRVKIKVSHASTKIVAEFVGEAHSCFAGTNWEMKSKKHPI